MRTKAMLIRILLIPGCIWAMACSRLEEERPKFPAVPDPLVEWDRNLEINGSGSVSFKADTGFPADKPYTIQVLNARLGTVRVEGAGQVRYSIDHNQWKRDSFTVRICREGVCREWIRRVVNRVPSDTLVLSPETQPYYLLYGSTLIRKLVPDSINGKLVRIKHRFYTPSIQAPDSIRMLYFSGGSGTLLNYGYDDIEYLIRRENQTYIRGNFSLVLGDTTEAKARPDSFYVPAGQDVFVLNASQIWENDQNQDGNETQFQIRIFENPDYGNEAELTTTDGRFRDFVQGGVQKIEFTRTNPQAKLVTFTYYLRAGTNNRITRSSLQLRFP